MLIKILGLVLICVGSFSHTPFAQSKLRLKIGAKIPVNYLPSIDEDEKYIATNPSQFRPFIEKIVDGVKYIIAYDKETRRIKYIQTIDRSFRTAKGLHVGSQIKVTKKQLSGGCCGWYTFAGHTADRWDIIVAHGEVSLSDWKESEIRKITVGGFKKSGN